MASRVASVSLLSSAAVGRALARSSVVAGLALAPAACGEDVHLGEFEGDTSSTGDAGGGDGGSGPGATTGTGAAVTASTTTGGDQGAAGDGTGGADGGTEGEGGSVSSGGPSDLELEQVGTPEAYLEACEVYFARIDELELELGCNTTGFTPSGICEGGVGGGPLGGDLSTACKLGMIPVIECYAASTEARDCFCEGALECSYYPACDLLFDGPTECFGGGTPTWGGARCGPGIGDCVDGKYCDFADDLCGAGETVGVCRPRTSCWSPWTEVCGCDGQPYGELCDAIGVGVDIDVAGTCRDPG